jgi:signal transduction histidine kinase
LKKNLSTYFILCAVLTLFYYGNSSCKAQVDSLKLVLDKQEGADRVLTLNELSYALHRSDTKQAILYAEEAVNLARQLNDSVLLALTLNDASIPYFISGDFQKALRYNLEILEIRAFYPDSIKTGSALSKIGNIYQELGQYEKALQYHEEALMIFEHFGFTPYIYTIKSNIAIAFQELNRLEEAYLIDKEVLEYARKNNDISLLCSVLNNLGITLRKQENFDEAEEKLLEMLQIAEENNIIDGQAVAHQSLGVNNRKKGNLTEGLKHYHTALKLYKKVNSKPGISFMDYNLGLVYSELNLLDSARFHLLEAISLSREMNSYNQLKNAFIGLSVLAEKENDFASALAFKDSVIFYKDLLFKTEGNEIIAEVFQKYQLAEKEKAIVEQDLQLAERKNQLITLILVVIVVSIFAALIFIRAKFKEQKLQKEMAIKEETSKRKLLEKIQGERERISRDLHDSLGAELTLISASADQHGYNAKDGNKTVFDEIAAISRNAMSILRETLWTLQNNEIDLDAFTAKLIQFTNSRKSLVDFEIANLVSQNIILSPNQSLLLYRICQEAIQNVIKHAEAAKVIVSFKIHKNELKVTICDNGKGFNPNNKVNGYGLKNIESRTKELTGNFVLESEIGGGTKLIICFPLMDNI